MTPVPVKLDESSRRMIKGYKVLAGFQGLGMRSYLTIVVSGGFLTLSLTHFLSLPLSPFVNLLGVFLLFQLTFLLFYFV